jgi:hypothetical protein
MRLNTHRVACWGSTFSSHLVIRVVLAPEERPHFEADFSIALRRAVAQAHD